VSSFTPEGYTAPSPNVTPSVAVEQTQKDVAEMQRVLKTAAKYPQLMPQEFQALVIDMLQVSNLTIPISQVFGFTQFIARSERVLTGETTTSTSYTDLATVGPTLTGVPPGKYIVLVSAYMFNSVGAFVQYMSPSFNSSTPVDDEGALLSVPAADTTAATVMGFSVKTFTTENNEIKAKYKVNGGTGAFYYRSLLALKVANA
jgi:hypothetical protein